MAGLIAYCVYRCYKSSQSTSSSPTAYQADNDYDPSYDVYRQPNHNANWDPNSNINNNNNNYWDPNSNNNANPYVPNQSHYQGY